MGTESVSDFGTALEMSVFPQSVVQSVMFGQTDPSGFLRVTAVGSVAAAVVVASA